MNRYAYADVAQDRYIVAVPDPLDSCTDEDLLAYFRKGQSDAFGGLVGRYERELYGYLRRYLGDANLADDVFQNTFLQLVVKINQYEPGRPVRPWLYTIATNQAIDALRRQGRHQALSLNQHRAEESNGEAHSLMDALESPAVGPGDLAEGQECTNAFARRGSVAGLPKAVLILAYFQGMKYRNRRHPQHPGRNSEIAAAALVKLHEMRDRHLPRTKSDPMEKTSPDIC